MTLKWGDLLPAAIQPGNANCATTVDGAMQAR
jgi:hypothetical protein